MASGVVTAVRDMVVVAQFDTDPPDIGELILVQSPDKPVLLVERLEKTKPPSAWTCSATAASRNGCR
jgi:hypothetical protein